MGIVDDAFHKTLRDLPSYEELRMEHVSMWLRGCKGWELKFMFFPHRCTITNKLLWFKRAYVGQRRYSDISYETHYVNPEDFIWWQLNN